MRQLLLDLGEENPPTLDTFVIGKNDELLQRLQLVTQNRHTIPQERFIYLWGEPGAGKSHLLQALATAPEARYLPANADITAYTFSPDVLLYLLDDCEQLLPETQIAAFSLFNQIRENGGLLIAAGATAPAALALREDLRTRLGWGLIYQLHGLSDDEKIAALHQTASARGIILSPGVLPYLITHFRRDMRSLSAMLDALDQYSLETQRPITLPLLRGLLQADGETEIS